MTGGRAGELDIVERAFWVVLGRAGTPTELRDERRKLTSASGRVLTIRLLSSPEFQALRKAWHDGRELRLVSRSRGLPRASAERRCRRQGGCRGSRARTNGSGSSRRAETCRLACPRRSREARHPGRAEASSREAATRAGRHPAIGSEGPVLMPCSVAWQGRPPIPAASFVCSPLPVLKYSCMFRSGSRPSLAIGRA